MLETSTSPRPPAGDTAVARLVRQHHGVHGGLRSDGAAVSGGGPERLHVDWRPVNWARKPQTQNAPRRCAEEREVWGFVCLCLGDVNLVAGAGFEPAAFRL